MGRVWRSWSWEKLDRGLQHYFSSSSPSRPLPSFPFLSLLPLAVPSLSLSPVLSLCWLYSSMSTMPEVTESYTRKWALSRELRPEILRRGVCTDFLWVTGPFLDSHWSQCTRIHPGGESVGVEMLQLLGPPEKPQAWEVREQFLRRRDMWLWADQNANIQTI